MDVRRKVLHRNKEQDRTSKIHFYKMRNILCEYSSHWKLETEFLQVMLKSIFTYGFESWTISKQAKSSLRPQRCGFVKECWKFLGQSKWVICFHKTQRYLIINTRKRQSFCGTLWEVRNWSCLWQQERFLKKETVEVTMRRFLTVFYHGDERCQQSNLYAADDNRMWRSMINNTSWESTWWW